MSTTLGFFVILKDAGKNNSLSNSPMTNSTPLWSFRIGVILVVFTHLYMLFFGLPEAQMMAHAILNLFAAVLILLGWAKSR